MVRRALIFLLLLSSGMCGAKSGHNRATIGPQSGHNRATIGPTVTRIFSASYCTPCHQLQAQLLREGHALLIVPVTGELGMPYPTFEYSTGARDDGSLYRSGGAALVAPVKFVEVIQ